MCKYWLYLFICIVTQSVCAGVVLPDPDPEIEGLFHCATGKIELPLWGLESMGMMQRELAGRHPSDFPIEDLGFGDGLVLHRDENEWLLGDERLTSVIDRLAVSRCDDQVLVLEEAPG